MNPFASLSPIFTKKLKNVSIEKYYSVGWSEDIPLYGPWLKKKGSFDVSVSDWEYSDSGFENPWSGEKFPQKRVSAAIVVASSCHILRISQLVTIPLC